MSPDWLPEPDHARSPLTGWTRAHWEACADRLIAGAHAHASPNGARVRFPSSRPQDATDELEGFARAFMLVGLRAAGRDGEQPAGWLEWCASALNAGTSPGHPEAWPRIGHHDQALVEATAIALALHWSRPWLWDNLVDPVRQRVVDWLAHSRDRWCADNNHVLFGATVQAFLASVGAEHNAMAIDGALNRIDDWYVGDGWYTDGVGRRFDHYNGWTFHLYPFFIEQMLAVSPEVATSTSRAFDLYRTRLRMFLDDYQHLFDGSGAPVLQGRSLIYRWGMAAPFWMGELQGVSPLPPGRTRRLASGMLAGFTDAGVLDDAVLDLGWKRPAPDLLQSYNAPGSPLWASKGFLGLLAPDAHRVWQDTETRLPVEEADQVRPLGGPRWLVAGDVNSGVVRVLNHGSDGHPRKDDRLYRRLAYSSATVPVDVDGLPDNTVAVGSGSTGHRGLLAGTVRREGAASRWRVDAEGRDVTIDVATLLWGGTEIRLVRLRGAVDQTVRCTGWALAADHPLETHEGPRWATAKSGEGLVSAVGWLASEGPEVGATPLPRVTAAPQRSSLGEYVGLPFLEGHAGSGGSVQFAWLVHLGREWNPVLAQQISVQWLADGAAVSVGPHLHHCGWAREATWAGDVVNQGVFRVGSVSIGD